MLLRGPTHNSLYLFPPPASSKSAPVALLGEWTTIVQWHHRLGHPTMRLVSQILCTKCLPFIPSQPDFFCSTCPLAKCWQLLFKSSVNRSLGPLQLIFVDVWGLHPLIYHEMVSVIISFVDDYSRYTWFYPLASKGDTTSIFLRFQPYVERLFNTTIKSIQSDWGGEFRPLTRVLNSQGISHLLSCPHTHQQNDVIERKHCHIVKTGLALLATTFLPYKFWADAFQTVAYLINFLPSPSLKNKSPHFLLYNKEPDYFFHKVFGSECWPTLWPYNNHKINFCLPPCLQSYSQRL